MEKFVSLDNLKKYNEELKKWCKQNFVSINTTKRFENKKNLRNELTLIKDWGDDKYELL